MDNAQSEKGKCEQSIHDAHRKNDRTTNTCGEAASCCCGSASIDMLKRFSAAAKVCGGGWFATVTPIEPPPAFLVVENPTRDETHAEGHSLPSVLTEDCRGRLQTVKADKYAPLARRFPKRKTYSESHRNAVASRCRRVPIALDRWWYVRHAL